MNFLWFSFPREKGTQSPRGKFGAIFQSKIRVENWINMGTLVLHLSGLKLLICSLYIMAPKIRCCNVTVLGQSIQIGKIWLGKPSTSTLLTSTFVFRSRGFPIGGFELEWSLVATSLGGFSVTSHEKRVPGALLKE